jgi:Secretion system C-terminal sorting domain
LVAKDETATVYITDAVGKLIVNQKLNNNEHLHQFNLSGVSGGMYYLKLVSSLGTTKVSKINILK